MNQSISFKSLNPAKLLAVFKQYHRLIVLLIIGCLFAYTGYRISQINSAQPDQAYINTHKNDLAVPNFKAYSNTLQQLRELDSSGDTTIPIRPGKQNPFSL